MNEEEVKARIVLPWLTSLGVPAGELSLETTFSVRIGRQTCTVGASEPRRRARLDVLVRRNGRNLVVIEVKKSGVPLNEEDRDQAISYARLVHPVAPLALVTNGNDFELFDSISKDRIEPQSTVFDDGYSVVLPETDRLEALRLFFACSPANLLTFCRAQVDLEVQPLMGGLTDYSAAYVPVLHVERSDCTMPVVHRFLESHDSAFLLVADAATGKTCAMVDIAKRLLEKGVPTLFFRGAMLESDILDAIDREVEWAFGRTEGSIETLHRLASSAQDQPVVVLVDGIDDWGHPGRVQHLTSLIAHLRAQEVRLLLSCKTDGWPRFLQVRGSPTKVEARIHQATAEQPFSLELPNFTEREFVTAVGKCRKAFAGPGAFDETAWTEAKRSPFLLRLLFQVASATGAAHLGFDPSFFEAYLNLVVQKTSAPETAAHTVAAIADVLFMTNEDWVGEKVIRERLRLGVNEAILPDLFDQGVLVGVGPPGVRRISFGFAPVRNYLTAFRAREWPRSSAEQFAADVTGSSAHGLRTEVETFYYPFAPKDQKAVLDGVVRENATAFIGLYTDVVTKHFGSFRDRFAPFTNGRAGFVAEFSLAKQALGFYGYRPIESQDEEVLFVPAGASGRSHKLMVLGASRVHYHSATKGFRSFDVKHEVLKAEICPQLREIVEKGRLSDSATPILAEEVIVSSIRAHKPIFEPLLDATGREPSYPITLADVERQFQKEILRRHFEDELVDHRRETGQIQETWHGTTVSCSWSLSQTDLANILARVDAAMARGERIKSNVTYVELERLWDRLSAAIQDRQRHGGVIEAPSLPLLRPLREAKNPAYPAFKNHCRQVLELSIASYKRLVEHNFPTLREHFSFYRRLPLSVILVVHPTMLTQDDRWGRYYLVDREGLNDTQVGVYDEGEVSEDGDTTRTPAGAVPSWAWHTASASTFLEGPWAQELELDEPGSVIRRWVYRWLRDDIQHVERALLAEYQLIESPLASASE